jgi:hypothetical protein
MKVDRPSLGWEEGVAMPTPMATVKIPNPAVASLRPRPAVVSPRYRLERALSRDAFENQLLPSHADLRLKKFLV